MFDTKISILFIPAIALANGKQIELSNYLFRGLTNMVYKFSEQA